MPLESIEIYVAGKFLKIARPKDEWIVDIEEPESIINGFEAHNIGADLFTFWQRYPDMKPHYQYYREWDNWAVLPITSFENWFNNQINRKLRAKIRKAPKTGVEVRITPLNDDYIAGVTKIFNETPFRQGKKFAHYGKTFQQVKEELSKESARTDFIGAYYQGEMIGFIQQVYVKDGAFPFGGVSLIVHRDKSANNAMLAKAVEACSSRGRDYLVYGHFDYGSGTDGLTEFKIHNGFQKMLVPRYYVPLTAKGSICLRLRLHHGKKRMIPKKIMQSLIAMRRKWYSRSSQV